MKYFADNIICARKLLTTIVLIITLATTIVCDDKHDSPVVQTKLGKILGSVMITDRNREFHAFRGVPYAKPPLKDLRFKAPIPAESWNYTLDGTHDGHYCLQYDYTNKTFTGDEDCLYLNVYTPSPISIDSALPVMVFIHGGGFAAGSGSAEMHGPQRLLDKEIVLVTINYRLGALGFLSTGDTSSPGNYGLLDQVEALKWVQKNIASFGGDSHSITIFGESAGSASVLSHLVSPLSKGLFQRAIAQSGAPWSLWAFDSDPLLPAVQLGERLKCSTGCTTKLMDCIRRHSAVEIISASILSKNVFAPILIYPVADVKYGGSFLPDNPFLLFRNNKTKKVPVLGGIMKDEGTLFYLFYAAAAGDLKKVNTTFLKDVLAIFNRVFALESDASEKAMDFIKKTYFSKSTTWEENIEAFSKFFGDSMISEDMNSALSMLVRNGNPTYAYRFSYRGENSFANIFFPPGGDIYNELKKYVTHVDDLIYLFRCDFFKLPQLNSQDLEMADVVLSLWTNFAKTGDPTLNGTFTKHPELYWERATAETFRYLDLNLESKMVDGNLTSNTWRKFVKEVIRKKLYSADKNHPVFDGPLGKMRGTVLKTDKGADIYAFRGIPYAQPPVGILRFQAPRQVGPWTGILDATEDVPACLQWDFVTMSLVGDEDCLYVNVYTPKLPSAENKEKLPVMVFIYGGGFITGSGKSSLYGPQRLLDKGVVLVTFNYRLGPLGFFSTGDDASPGNYGMLDQVMVLQGVQQFIAPFGGDPNRVTIFGESSGSSSVMQHLVSPLSQGLFHGVIAQSGSPASSYAVELNPEISAQKVARQLDCPSNTSAALVACLRTKSALDLTTRTTIRDFTADPTKKFIYRLKPVVDTFAGQNAFLPEFPNKLMADGKLKSVPIILGTVKDEGAISYGYLKMATKSKPDLFQPENMEELMEWIISSKFESKEESVAAAIKIREEFFGKKNDSDKHDVIKRFVKILNDVEVVYDVNHDVDLLLKRGFNPYLYKLTYRGERSFTDVDQVCKVFIPKDLGAVSHYDDLQYLFHLGFFESHNLSDEDQRMADVILTLWTNFAKTQVPSLDGSDVEHKDFVWETSSVEKPRYLDLSPKPKMADGHLCERKEFWRAIFKKTSKPL